MRAHLNLCGIHHCRLRPNATIAAIPGTHEAPAASSFLVPLARAHDQRGPMVLGDVCCTPSPVPPSCTLDPVYTTRIHRADARRSALQHPKKCSAVRCCVSIDMAHVCVLPVATDAAQDRRARQSATRLLRRLQTPFVRYQANRQNRAWHPIIDASSPPRFWTTCYSRRRSLATVRLSKTPARVRPSRRCLPIPHGGYRSRSYSTFPTGTLSALPPAHPSPACASCPCNLMDKHAVWLIHRTPYHRPHCCPPSLRKRTAQALVSFRPARAWLDRLRLRSAKETRNVGAVFQMFSLAYVAGRAQLLRASLHVS
ncbi:hypothetical protein C8R47DRAFT_572329 [Mycena vitilis]|nr:hypothetical protein C8R47DRAFT_572329 [Mycena vitilis]